MEYISYCQIIIRLAKLCFELANIKDDSIFVIFLCYP